jgi:hypothetical protein
VVISPIGQPLIDADPLHLRQQRHVLQVRGGASWPLIPSRYAPTHGSGDHCCSISSSILCLLSRWLLCTPPVGCAHHLTTCAVRHGPPPW